MNNLLRTFTDDFAAIVAECGEQTAIMAEVGLNDIKITYSQISEYIDKFLGLFADEGLQPGDTIMALLPNSAEALLCFLATMKGGYGYAPLPCSASEREIERWISLVKPKLCIKKSELCFDINTKKMNAKMAVLSINCDNKFAFLPAPRVHLQVGEQPRLYLSTSGTTGDPKAMLFDSNRLWSSGVAFAQYHCLNARKTCFWNYLPMSYLGGLFNLGLIPLCAKGSIIITEPFSGKTFLSFWQTIQKWNVNSLWLVPTIARGLLSLAKSVHMEKQKHQEIHTCFIGTAPIDLATKQEFEDYFGISVFENFALSETTFFTSESVANISKRGESSVGEILPYTEVKFEKKDEQNDFGEMKVKSPFLFLGYIDQKGKIELPLDEDGYFGTGDTGYMNKDNVVVITGRREEIIKKGGLFVSLKEIELLIGKLAYIEDVAAVRIPHKFYGESYALFVIPKDATVPKPDLKSEVSCWIHSNLVKYKWPEEIVVSESFPKTASGKIKKGLLGEKYA